MISRRLLRIKVLKVLFAYFESANNSQPAVEKELAFSIKKTYDLYISLFLLLTDVADYAKERIDIGKQKYLKTDEEQNPNMRFVNNSIINIIKHNKYIQEYVKKEKLSWNDTDCVKTIYNNIINSEYYKTYMSAAECSFDDDKNFILDVLKNEIENFDDIHTYLEEKNIYWVDDLEFVLSMAIRTVQKFKQNQSEDKSLMPLYKDESDEHFAQRLLRRTLSDYDKNKAEIDEQVKNWDVDRIAFMDVLILQLALAEFMEFPDIPTSVTIDEYLEISKFFSSSTSSIFINGVLDKIISNRKKSKLVNKII